MQPTSSLRYAVLFWLSCIAVSCTLRAEVILDGAITIDEYDGLLLATQTVHTEYGDNLNELDAAFGFLDQEGLSIGLTGSLVANSGPGGYNALVILVDSRPGGVRI